MNMLRTLGLLGVATVIAYTPTPAWADSWAMPTTTTYTSRAGQARVTVTPRDLRSQLDYFEGEVGGMDRPGQKDGGSRAARARLERLSDKRWVTVWEGRIANDVAPVLAIVRDDGGYLVTFDDWHGTGYGPNAVVVYGPKGERVRTLALSAIVPADYIDALPHSVSSIQWRGVPRFSDDGRRVLIPVVVPSDDGGRDPAMVEVAVDVADGTVSPVNRKSFDAALATGRKVRAGQVAAEATHKAAFLAPLLGPKVNAEREWHDYLREAVGRSVGDAYTAATTVLRAPDAKDYAVSETWVRAALTGRSGRLVALGSLSEPNLVSVLEEVAIRIHAGSLSGTTVFVAVSDRHWRQVRAAMATTGATLVQLDPDQPIPQRPERIARRYGR